MRAVMLGVGAERVPVLPQHDLRFVEIDGIVRAGLAVLRSQPVQAAAAIVREQHCVGHLGAIPGLEMLLEEARHFHDVRVGVVNDAAAGVGHCPSEFLCRL